MIRITTVATLAAALIACGQNSQRSESASPVDPANLNVELVGADSALLSWEHDGGNVSGWWLFLQNAESWSRAVAVNQNAALPASERSYLFEGLTKGTSYKFGVKANGAGTGSAIVYSDALEVPADPNPDPEPDPDSEDESVSVTLTADERAMTASFSSTSALGENVLVTLAKVSTNKTVQIDRYQIGSESFQSATDWVGPYNMRTVAATTQTDKAYGFTGGWHGSNGDGTGDPTAVTDSIRIWLDGEPFSSGTSTGKEATVIVWNRVEAANTKFDESKRFTLSEKVTYTFKDNRLYVTTEATGLEDVSIRIYYGMQIGNGFCAKFTFTTEDGATNETTESYLCSGKVRDLTGYSAGGHSVTAHMNDEGLGTFSLATPAYSALTQYYGTNNGKGYYMLIGDMGATTKQYVLKEGATIYWNGYYEFR